MFPYYIVRFKPDYNAWKQALILEFPYCIVRFKHLRKGFQKLVSESFHTTQYDLNEIFKQQKFHREKFPYYIVRFKRIYFCLFLFIYFSFHTT